MSKNQLRTAESVSPKHPDKICDQISDAILDAHLAQDPLARVAVDVAGGHGAIFVSGEITSRAESVDVKVIVERLAGDVELHQYISAQSHEIANGVDVGGAGNQGIMVGYACSETTEMLPLEVILSRRLNQYLYAIWPHDGKTQITVCDKNIDTIVASWQHTTQQDLRLAVQDWARMQASEFTGTSYFVKCRNSNPKLHVNPAGDWQIGGFEADAGLTGRKLVVDNYGPRIPVGGGAYSGKDPSKVDRSAAYMTRKIAIDYLRQLQAEEVYCYLAYAIGYDQPIEATVIVDGIAKVIDGYDLSPAGIIESLELRRPIYEQTARYGHFGHSQYTWEH